MSQELPIINGELLRLRRETRGWALSDLATRACMSVKQIRQLEEGGASAFYSETVKWTSAKKVGALLGMQPEEVFVPAVVEPQVLPDAVSEPSAVVDTSVPAAAPSMPAEPLATAADADAFAASQPMADASDISEKSKTPVWALTALFVAALAVAAWMRPEPEVVTEPVPPLQNISADATAAQAASDAVAAEAVAPVASQAQKPVAASSPASASTAASSAAVVAKPANAAPAPAASAASKPL